MAERNWGWMAILIFFFLAPFPLPAEEIYRLREDQQNGQWNIQYWQQFQPQRSGDLLALELLGTSAGQGGIPLTITLEGPEGGVGEPITARLSDEKWERIPLAGKNWRVEAGKSYLLKLVHNNQIGWYCYMGGDRYPQGRAFQDGREIPDRDLWFTLEMGETTSTPPANNPGNPGGDSPRELLAVETTSEGGAQGNSSTSTENPPPTQDIATPRRRGKKEGNNPYFSPHIFGIHAAGIGDWVESARELGFGAKKGWALLLALAGQTPDLELPFREGFSLILRIDNNYGGWTIPEPVKGYESFAGKTVATIRHCQKWCKVFVVGNEMNTAWEGDGRVGVSAIEYVKCFKAVKKAVATARREGEIGEDVQLVLGAVGPWNSSGPLNPGEGGVPWNNYLDFLLENLAEDIEGVAIHAYGGRRGNGGFDADPRDDDGWGFGVFREQMESLANHPNTRELPVYLTEMNTAAGGDAEKPAVSYTSPSDPEKGLWSQENWMHRAYSSINRWNQEHEQKIRCALWFVYFHPGWRDYSLGNQDSPNLRRARFDFKKMVENQDWRWD